MKRSFIERLFRPGKREDRHLKELAHAEDELEDAVTELTDTMVNYRKMLALTEKTKPK